MSKIAVVYWSGTGNTEKMAELIADGAKAKGGDVSLFTSADFNKSMLDEYSAIAFGCPSMGAEELEETEFQPMWDDVKDGLAGKKIALFGSYGWGDGEWMRNWEEEVAGATSFICNEEPDAEAETACKEMGESLVG